MLFTCYHCHFFNPDYACLLHGIRTDVTEHLQSIENKEYEIDPKTAALDCPGLFITPETEKLGNNYLKNLIKE